MGCESLSSDTKMKLLSYADHPDPVTAVACLVGVVLGLNGPIYPLYLIALVGRTQGYLAFLTMLAYPIVLAVPLLARREPVGARVTLWLTGTLNTVWCMKLLGPSGGVAAFLLPCIGLAALLPSRWMRLAGAGLPPLLLLIPARWFGVPLMSVTAVQNANLIMLNEVSAACLIGLLAVRLGPLLQDAPASPDGRHLAP